MVIRGGKIIQVLIEVAWLYFEYKPSEFARGAIHFLATQTGQ